MSELVECQVCHFQNPAERKQKRERCEGCDGSLDEAVPVALAEIGSTESADVMDMAQDQSAESTAFCQCLFPARDSTICRTCGLPGSSGSDGAAPKQAEPSGTGVREESAAPIPQRYRLRYGNHSSLRIESGLLIGRGYAGVPPDFADWLGLRQGISRRHCLIQVGGGLSITDLGSTNGTTVSGAPIAPGIPHPVAADWFPLTIGLGNHASVTIERYEDMQ